MSYQFVMFQDASYYTVLHFYEMMINEQIVCLILCA